MTIVHSDDGLEDDAELLGFDQALQGEKRIATRGDAEWAETLGARSGRMGTRHVQARSPKIRIDARKGHRIF
jgi:hypothetical protein